MGDPDTTRFLTVVDRLRALDVEPEPALSWRCGAAVRQAWRDATGHEPARALRPKTSGQGTHVHAVYPPAFADTIDRVCLAIVVEVQADRLAQLALPW
jgi:hypothetical protein